MAMNRAAGLVDRIKQGDEGIAPVLSLIQVVCDTATQALERHREGALDIEGVMSALQFDSSTKLNVSHTFVEDLLNMNEKSDSSRFANSFSILNFVLIGVAFLSVLGFVLGLIGAAQVASNKQRKNSSRTVDIAYWAIFMVMSGFVALTSLETTAWNKLLGHVSGLMWGQSSQDDPFAEMSNLQTTGSSAIPLTSALGVASGVSTGASTGLTTPLVGIPNNREPVFCDAAFAIDSPQLNKYPRGSVVYQYNMRRLALMTPEDFPELQYVQSLMDDPNYPNMAGGISTNMARAFGGISNECEEFNGDVVQCCSEANCQTAIDPALCLQQRCPGKVLHVAGGGQHCRCVEITSKLGLQVEYKQVALCGTQLQDWLRDQVAPINSAAARSVLAAAAGCSGNYDASAATLAGPATLQTYMMGPFSDKDAFGLTSSYVTLNSGGNPAAVTLKFQLTSCSNKDHFFRIRYANALTSPVTMAVTFDDVPATVISFPAGSTSAMRTDVTFRIPGVPFGDHTLGLVGNAGGLPWIHRVVACVDSTTMCADAF